MKIVIEVNDLDNKNKKHIVNSIKGVVKALSKKFGFGMNYRVEEPDEVEEIGLTLKQLREIDKLYSEMCKELGTYKRADYAWRKIYNKVLALEKKYAKDGNLEHVNHCIRLENLMNYFKEDLTKSEADGE